MRCNISRMYAWRTEDDVRVSGNRLDVTEWAGNWRLSNGWYVASLPVMGVTTLESLTSHAGRASIMCMVRLLLSASSIIAFLKMRRASERCADQHISRPRPKVTRGFVTVAPSVPLWTMLSAGPGFVRVEHAYLGADSRRKLIHRLKRQYPSAQFSASKPA